MTKLKTLNTPIFKEEGIPSIDIAAYSLQVEGLGKKYSLTLEEILKLPQSTLDCRLTSVSGFSVRANWQGVLWKDMFASLRGAEGHEAISLDQFNFVIFESFGGYKTNVYKEDILPDRWIFCHSVDGERLEPEYGAPLRMIIPNLWGYKSCKWLTKVKFSERNESGFWETHGYDDRGLIEPGKTLDINTHTRKPIKGGEVTEF